jgi:prephenate dehydrogenase
VQTIGAHPFFLDPLEHDAFVAAMSHLPFIAATALVRMTTQSPSWNELRRLAGIDFENASAAVAADPDTYNDICQTNKEAILRWIDEYMTRLAEMRNLVEQGGADLRAAFSAAQEERARWMATRDEVMSELPPLPSAEGTAGQFRQMLLGGLARERPLPGEKKSK